MKIEVKVSVSGEYEAKSVSLAPGVHEVSDLVGKDLVRAGHAVEVSAKGKDKA